MIALVMNKPEYENDIRALLMAFFYGEKIVLNAAEWNCQLTVIYEVNQVKAIIKDAVGKVNALSDFCDYQDYKETRNVVKRMIYRLLHDFTGRVLPWGTLTGIRPTKISMALFEDGYTFDESVAYLKDIYYTSDEKASLCTEVALNERSILEGIDYEHSYSLYVGIPFCPSICAYCSFSSYPLSVWEKQVDLYVDRLIDEIRQTSDLMSDRQMLTFYMGGGTPTSLTANQMDRLLNALEKYYDFKNVREKTIEAGRPDSITADKLHVIKSHGIERISINPQTMNQQTLDLIGRRHTTEDIESAFELARKIGFQNINMDLIAGLPGETLSHMKKTMDDMIRLSPDSLTVHALALKRAAFLNQNREKFPVADADEVNRMIGLSKMGAEQIGARPYYLYRQKNIAGNLENVGYAKPGCEGLYNILIMEEKQSILALGAGASSKFVYPNENRIERSENVKDVRSYIERVDEMVERKRKRYLNMGI